MHVFRVVLAHGIIRLRQYWVLCALWRKINAEDRRNWFNKGYIIRQNILTQRELAQLQAEFESCRESMRETWQGDTCTASLLLTDQHRKAIPNTQGILQSETIRPLFQFCSGFFLPPWAYFLSITKKQPPGTKASTPRKSDPQKNAHADAFHPTMKAWLFLHDVTPEHGPFTYYPASHKLSWRRLKWEYHRSVNFREYTDGYSERGSFRLAGQDFATLALPEPEVFTVKANTLIIANTYGFHHRGQSGQNSRRDSLWFSA